MIIYRSVVETIDYELKHKEEVKRLYNCDDETYYAYMTGRMGVIIELLLDKDCKIAD